MNKKEFLKRIRRSLTGLPREEINKLTDYYSEIIDDATEGGKAESTVIAELGYPEKIAADYIVENNCESRVKKPKSALNITLLILGSPIWLSIGAALFAAAAAVFASLFAVTATVIGIGIGFSVGGVAGFLLSIPLLFGDFPAGITQMGVVATLFGIGLLCSFAIVPVINFTARIASKLINFAASKFKRAPVGKKELAPVRIGKPWYITAAVCALAGVVLTVVGLGSIGFDYKRLDKSADFAPETKEFAVTEIGVLDVRAENSDVIIKRTDGDKIKVTYYVGEGLDNGATAEGGTLSVKIGYAVFDERFSDTLKYGIFYGTFNGLSSRTTIEVPADYAGELTVKTSNKDVTLSDQTGLTAVKLESANGDIVLTNVKCDGLDVVTANGEIVLKNVEAGVVKATTSNKDITLQGLRSDDINLVNANGEIAGVIYGNKGDYAITASTSNAENNLTDSTGGGKRLVATTSNDDIFIKFE